MSDDIKSQIIAYVKSKGRIPTSFGDVAVDGPLVGQGGNGLVYPIDFEGPAVIKLLTEQVTDNPSTKLKRFQREYRRLVRILPQQNLVRLFHYDVVTLRDGLCVPVIIMERCEVSLKKYVQDNGPLPATVLRTLCVQLCKALHRIHEHGIIHRDIKPENVLLRGDGTFVLADFGIAWFDPEVYEGTDLTKRGDRMANLQFSAPEQFEKDSILTPSADVFALGQVLYWCVTQQTFRGTSPAPMTSIDESYESFDSIVALMSKQDPDARIQTAKGVVAWFDDNEEEVRKEKWHQHVIDSLFAFEHLIRRCAPGNRGIAHLTDKSDIDRLFCALSEICKPDELWWTQGNTHNAIRKMFRSDDGTWVLDGTEYHVTDCWVSRDKGLDHCFVLMRSEAMPSFGIYGDHEHEDEMVGLVNGKYITSNEHDDGYARIGDDIVEVRGISELRHRYLRPNYCFIATKYNSVLVQQADRILDSLTKAYHAGKEVDKQELIKLWQLPKHPVSQMRD